MTVPTSRIRADFDRLAALDGGGWDHNRHYHGFLLRRLPEERGTALEVGCGTGELARCLAREFGRVTAIDLSPGMLRRARELSRAVPNLEYRQADLRAYHPPAEGFDCIAAVATLHHLPLAESLEKLAAALRPGGVLLVLDLYRPRTPADHAWSALALPADLLLRAWKLRRLREPTRVRRAWSEHARHDAYPTLAEVRSLAGRVLPGAAVRRHLFWRWSLVWRKPSGSTDPAG